MGSLYEDSAAPPLGPSRTGDRFRQGCATSLPQGIQRPYGNPPGVEVLYHHDGVEATITDLRIRH